MSGHIDPRDLPLVVSQLLRRVENLERERRNVARSTQTFPPVGARVYRTSGVGILTGVGTAIQWQDAEFDTSGFWDDATAPTRLTVTDSTAGRYAIAGGCSWAADNNGRRVIAINRSGAQIAGDSRMTVTQATFETAMSCATIVDLAAGDYVELFVRQDAGYEIQVSGGTQSTFLAMMRVGPATST